MIFIVRRIIRGDGMRQLLEKYVFPLTISAGSDEFLREQYRSLTRLVPLLYVACITTCFALTIVFDHGQAAPGLLARVVPIALMIGMAIRSVKWFKARKRVETTEIPAIRKEMRATEILGPGIAGSFAAFTLFTMQYSTPLEQSLAVLAVWITATASAFCLTALPIAGILVIAAATLPLSFWFFASGATQFIALGGVFVMSAAMIIMILYENFKRFTDIINSRTLLTEKQQQTELARQAVVVMAFTDALTDMPNRRAFEKKLYERVHKTGGTHPFAVGIIDLDGFKPINDIYGHAVGDEVLIQIGHRLSAAMAGKGDVARVGGDEFAVIASGLSTDDEVVALGMALKAALEETIVIGTISAHLTISCGFSQFPQSGSDPDRLIDRADMALYKAKAEGRGGVRVFDAAYEATAFERAMIEQELRAAIAKNALAVHFQPIVNLSDGSLSGFEALARWKHPKLGSISPAVFVPIAEQVGLIEAMTDGLLRKACAIAREWPANLMLAFNLSAEQLVKPGAGLRIISILAEMHFPPSRLEAEVTETALMKDIDAARTTINSLKAAGCRVSLDDFGTGYSSLSQIKDLPLDKIKIDKSFVDHICSDQKMSQIVRSIINMCGHLELACVAEGIEEPGQLARLKEKGCNHGQGYLFSRPLPKEEVQLLLAETGPIGDRHIDKAA